MNASVNNGAVSNAASADSTGEVRKKVRRRCHLHTTIDSHERPVTRMVIGYSSQSSYVATASSKGTTIRVFGLWHLGSRSCQIVSLSWNGMADSFVDGNTGDASGRIWRFTHSGKRRLPLGRVVDGVEEAAAPARWRSSIAWRVSATGVGGGWEGGGGGCIDDCDGGGGQSSDMMVWQLCGISDGGEGGIFFCLSRQSGSARKSNASYGVSIPFIQNTMPQTAFVFLRNFIHFSRTKDQQASGRRGYDPLFKVRSIINMLMERIRTV
eukprot:scaffold100628_cov85-Cyclotella_meneghiniana.AAC.3